MKVVEMMIMDNDIEEAQKRVDKKNAQLEIIRLRKSNLERERQ